MCTFKVLTVYLLCCCFALLLLLRWVTGKVRDEFSDMGRFKGEKENDKCVIMDVITCRHLKKKYI